ncbi:MAG: response regulator [Candidatus Nitricoxidivorans perseverans]|uniref:Response regulator n=1 Tax=Candidatus Nitricoxidivorans perseverans TaxID=2975601 RepID=A0AA49IU49_9PROT|nr:MAG: response regulator [Candidatus Nitricoxidivorans perseverans]
MNRILIVEDDPDMARVLTRALRSRGFETVSVRDVDAALAAADAAPPDYAILDLKLETGSGLSLIGPLKSINPAVKVLILTGYASIATAVDAIKLGASHYLAKPAYIGEILSGLGIDAVTADNDAGAAIDQEKRYSLAELEWKHILRTLSDQGGNVSAAARALNMHRRTLQRKLAMNGDSVLAEIREKSVRRFRRERQQMASGG